MPSVFEAVLLRDRAIIIAALGAITVLAWADLIWLADDMSMGGMDMTGFRMIPSGLSLMMPASEPWNSALLCGNDNRPSPTSTPGLA